MSEKKLNPTEMYLYNRRKSIATNKKNKALLKATADFVLEGVKANYSSTFIWLGRPIIQIPQDMFAMQEIIWSVRPDYIIETGIAHGGSIIYYASILELTGNGRQKDLPSILYNKVEKRKGDILNFFSCNFMQNIRFF